MILVRSCKIHQLMNSSRIPRGYEPHHPWTPGIRGENASFLKPAMIVVSSKTRKTKRHVLVFNLVPLRLKQVKYPNLIQFN